VADCFACVFLAIARKSHHDATASGRTIGGDSVFSGGQLSLHHGRTDARATGHGVDEDGSGQLTPRMRVRIIRAGGHHIERRRIG